MTRGAPDQSSRYVDLDLSEEDLIKSGVYILVTYTMRPKAGYDYLATAARFAAEHSLPDAMKQTVADALQAQKAQRPLHPVGLLHAFLPENAAFERGVRTRRCARRVSVAPSAAFELGDRARR